MTAPAKPDARSAAVRYGLAVLGGALGAVSAGFFAAAIAALLFVGLTFVATGSPGVDPYVGQNVIVAAGVIGGTVGLAGGYWAVTRLRGRGFAWLAGACLVTVGVVAVTSAFLGSLTV